MSRHVVRSTIWRIWHCDCTLYGRQPTLCLVNTGSFWVALQSVGLATVNNAASLTGLRSPVRERGDRRGRRCLRWGQVECWASEACVTACSATSLHTRDTVTQSDVYESSKYLSSDVITWPFQEKLLSELHCSSLNVCRSSTSRRYDVCASSWIGAYGASILTPTAFTPALIAYGYIHWPWPWLDLTKTLPWSSKSVCQVWSRRSSPLATYEEQTITLIHKDNELLNSTLLMIIAASP